MYKGFIINRSGSQAVYTVASKGSEPQRLTWYASSAVVMGLTVDGTKLLYASGRETAPLPQNHLCTVPVN